MTALLTRSKIKKASTLVVNRIRWMYRPPLVKGAVPKMHPGVMRMNFQEEEAAAEAAREVIRSKRLFRYFGASANPLQRSKVKEFEKIFAQTLGVKHAVAVNSGTSALQCALRAMGVGPGDEVIVPAYTWFSSAGAVVDVGAVPIIVEVDDSLTLCPKATEAAITEYTKAIIPVHVRGAPANMDAFMALAEKYNLQVLEDCAQAAGGEFKGRKLGTIGHVGAFSFHPTKIITTGEGGMVITNDDALHRRTLIYHDTAVCPHEGVSMEEWLTGVNFRMPEIIAALGLVQVHRMSGLIQDMRERKELIKAAVLKPLEAKGVTFRTINDPGDTAIALIFFLPDHKYVGDVISQLVQDNIPASPLYQFKKYLPHDHIDLHAYNTWTPIMNQRGWSDRWNPWINHPRKITYEENMCPQTLDLLARSVHIHISPDMTLEQAQQFSAAIEKAVDMNL